MRPALGRIFCVNTQIMMVTMMRKVLKLAQRNLIQENQNLTLQILHNPWLVNLLADSESRAFREFLYVSDLKRPRLNHRHLKLGPMEEGCFVFISLKANSEVRPPYCKLQILGVFRDQSAISAYFQTKFSVKLKLNTNIVRIFSAKFDLKHE